MAIAQIAAHAGRRLRRRGDARFSATIRALRGDSSPGEGRHIGCSTTVFPNGGAARGASKESGR
jgi:hypothetical protein